MSWSNALTGSTHQSFSPRKSLIITAGAVILKQYWNHLPRDYGRK
jgi:hypothetical protein